MQLLVMKNEMSFNLGKSIFSIYATFNLWQHLIYDNI
jgi:hypothetical protein